VKVLADKDVCISAGMCVMSADAVFDQGDDDGIVVLLGDGVSADGDSVDVPADQHDAVREAVKLCPSGALRLVD
jgi:ferredoxin